MFLFMRMLPAISIFEMRDVVAGGGGPNGGGESRMKRCHRAIYGLMAEFETPTELVQRPKRAHAAGYRKMDAYSAFPDRGGSARRSASTRRACR